MPCTLVPTLASPPVPDPKFRPRPFFEQCLTLATPPYYRTESRSSDPTSVPLSLHLRRAQTSGWGAGMGVGLSAKPQRVRKARLTLPIIPPAVVLQAGLRPLRVAAGGRGRRLGPVDPVGRLQPDVRRRRVLLQPSLRQPQVSPQAPMPGERGGRSSPPTPPAPFLCRPPPFPGRRSGASTAWARDGGTVPATPM